MSFNKRHTLELLTENQFTTVSIYFRTQAQAERNNAPKPVQKPASRFGTLNNPRTPWAMSGDDFVAAQFPFIEQSIPDELYVYKCSFEMAQKLMKGSLVIVPGGPSLTDMRVATVWQVHATAQINFEADFGYKWIAQMLDLTDYQDQIEKERTFAATMLEVEKVRQYEAIRASVLNTVQPGTEAHSMLMQALSVMKIAAPAPAPAPVAEEVKPAASSLTQPPSFAPKA